MTPRKALHDPTPAGAPPVPAFARALKILVKALKDANAKPFFILYPAAR